MDAEGARFISGGGQHATADIIGQAGKSPVAIGVLRRRLDAASAHGDRLAAQLRVVQQLDGRKKCVHVEVRDAPLHGV